MRKMNRAVSFVLIVLTALAGITCKQNIGMGGQIDILPPSGKIIYPDARETPIRGSFVLQGTASDDDGIQSISVVFENIETKEKSKVYNAEGFSVGSTSASWTIQVKNEWTAEAAPHELVKKYDIPDGEYTATVSVTDKGGKTSTFTKTYKIDNTPPVFILSRPSAIAGKDESPSSVDGYGAVFSVVGQAGERNTVEKLSVCVPGTPINITNMFVGNNINAEIAASPNDLYKSLDDLQGVGRTQPIKGQLYLYDNAREYKGENASGDGNKAEWFYQWTAIYPAVIAKGYTPEVISDYFAGKKGSNASNANEHDKKIYALRNDSQALTVLKEKMIKMDDSRTVFQVDPSISPGFKVIGVKHFSQTPNSSNISQASSMLFKSGNDTIFSVELIPNKDNIPLVAGSDLAAYKDSNIQIVLQKWNGTKFDSEHPIVLVDFKTLTDLSLIKTEGGKLRVQCTFPSTQGEGIYAVQVKGTDTSGDAVAHSFQAYNDSNTASGMYIINFLTVGTGPRIRPVRPQGFKNASFTVEADVSGVGTGGGVYCKVDAEVPTTPDSSTVTLTKVPAAQDPSGLRYSATLNTNSLNSGEHKIYFLVKSGAGASDTDDTVFTVDKEAPQVEILSPDLSKNQSGDFTMRGSVIDTPSGVKSIKYIVGKQNADITIKPSETSSNWKALTLSGDSWAIPFTDAESNNITQAANAQNLGKKVDGVDLYDIPIFFLVEDKAGDTTQKGNTSIIRQVIRVDPNGDIPGVTVLSPEANKVLGGTIRISGTVSVPNPAAGQVGSVWIQITDKTKTGNPNEPDFSKSALFGGNEWCLPASEGKQLTSYTEGSPYWSVEINGSKEFEPSSGTQRVIWFRLRGKNTKATPVAGQWTAPVKIIVDKAAPTITDMKIATEGKIGTAIPSGPIDPENQTYSSNMWIKGDNLYLCADLAHDAGIEKIDISGTYLGAPVSLTGNSQITGYQLHNKLCFVQAGNKYKMRIPLKTTTNPGSNNGFTINVTIKAKKNGEVEGLTASTSFSFKYDNTKPTAVFGTKIYSTGIVKVSEKSFTDPALKGKTNINTSMKFFASGQDIKITAFDRTIGKVTLEAAPTNPTTGYLIYSPIEYLRPDSSGKVGVFGAAYDVGAGVEKVKVNYNNVSTTEVVLESPSGVQTDVGNGDVNFVTWKGELNVSSIADGKGKIVIIPIDRANNEHAPIEVPVKLKKDSLKINSVELGTDINRNATIANDGSTVETKTLALNYDAANPEGIDSEKYDWHGKADAGTFRFKNDKSHIKIGTAGGSGAKNYTLKCVTNGQVVRGLTALPSNGVITLNAADFTKIGQSDDLATSNPKKRKLLLTVWDSAQGLTAGTDTWKAELTFEVFVDTIDRVQPTNTIDPFKWDSESKNSLYGNSRANGHIEIGTDLPSAFTAGGTGLMDRDDKVSGKISITGTAHDDQVITEIWAKIDGFTFTGGTLGTGDDAGYTKVATFASGSFAATGNFNDDGWHFSVKSSNFSVENGHTVEWKLNWNTEKLTGGVGLDKKITIKVKDTNPANTVPKERKVDVVPYIREVTTALTGSAGVDFDRSALGFYPVYAGEKITLKGFNIKSSPSVKLGAKDLTSKVSAYNSTAGTFDVEIEDAADVKTGELTVTVGGIKAINNDNKNPVIGTDGTVTAAAYNAWQNRANKRLADDLKLSVWKVDQFDSGIQKDITSPMLKIAPDSTWYMSYGKGVPEMVVNKNGTETTVDYSFNKFNNTAVAFDSTGNIYAVGTNTDRIDDSSAKFSFYSRAEPKSSSNSDYTEAWIGKSRLEKVFNQGIYNINRVPRPKLVVTGNTTLTKVYISYFDANHVKNPVKFRYGNVDGSNTFTDGIADGGGTNTSAEAMDSLPNGSAPNYHTIADDDSAEYKGGPYVAHGVTSSGVAVVAWYDASKKRLVYSYNTAPQTAVQGGVWQTNAQVIDSDFAGWYVDLAVDEKDGIHIAYYSSSKGDLKYAYLPKYDKSATVVTVDSYLSVGTQISISTRNEGNAATPKIVPYISYFQSAFTQTPSSVRVAWLPKGVTTTVHGTEIEVTGVEDGAKDELFTGNWEVMTIPMSGIVPKDETICNGVPTSGGWANTVVLGFMSDDGYKKAVLRK